MTHVLLVEDEPNIASIIVFKLKREGHEVRWETSARAVPDRPRPSSPTWFSSTRACRTAMPSPC
jgi:DNA-binding response OmpR family regulator